MHNCRTHHPSRPQLRPNTHSATPHSSHILSKDRIHHTYFPCEGERSSAQRCSDGIIENARTAPWNMKNIRLAFDVMCDLGEQLGDKHLTKLEKSLERLLNLQCHYDSYLVTLLYLAQERLDLIEKLSQLLPPGTTFEIHEDDSSPNRIVLLSPRGEIFVSSRICHGGADNG